MLNSIFRVRLPLLFSALLFSLVFSRPERPFSSQGAAASVDHAAWDALLRKHVNVAGQVDYAGFASDKIALDRYLRTLAANPPAGWWSRTRKMAYWINAYNAFTVDLIVKNYPLTSILSLDGGKTWDVKRISLGGQTYSLNQIENEILRARFNDPRIHFAINCAANSCPPLYNRAYTAANLERRLMERTRAFVNDTRFNRLAPDHASVSKIFEWYSADFSDLKAFLNRYAAVQLQPAAAIDFQEYDWALNAQ